MYVMTVIKINCVNEEVRICCSVFCEAETPETFCLHEPPYGVLHKNAYSICLHEYPCNTLHCDVFRKSPS